MRLGPFQNTLLRHLTRSCIERLDLHAVQLPLRHPLQVPGEELKHLFFVEEGIGSMTTIFKDGFQVEVGMFAYESAVGISALMGTKKGLNSIFMQVAGHGFSCPLGAALAEFNRHGKFHYLALRYVQAQLTQATQSAACNAHHDLSQRLARWLLICSDRTRQKTFKLSQEFLAQMIGTTRPTLSLAASVLKTEGLISYTRGTIIIHDQERLERRACECFRVVKDHLDNFAEFDTGFVV